MNRLTFSLKTDSIIYFLILVILSILITSCDTKLVSNIDEISPDSVVLEKIAEGQIQLSWEYNISDNDSIMYYISRKSGESGWVNYLDYTENLFYLDFVPTSTTIVYSYQITAYNYGTGEMSPPSEIVGYFSEYAYPTDLEVVQISQNEIELTWLDNSIGEEGFYIDKKISTGDWLSKYAVVGANQTSFVDLNDVYEEITFRVKAFSGISNTPVLLDTIITTLLPPSDVVLEKPDNQQIRITWQDNSQGEEGFYIDRKVGESEWVLDYAYVESPTTTYIDDITLPCGDFYYRVRAVDGIYSSPYSGEEKISIFLDLIGTTATSGNALEVFISEETNWYTVISDLYSGFALIDCVNPSEPDNQDYNEEGLPDRTISVFIKGNMLYLTTLSGLEEHGRMFIVDLSPILPYHGIEFPNVLFIAADVPVTGDPDDSYVPYDIYVEGDYAYIADGENGLEILYIATSNPVHVANVPTGGVARKVYIDGEYAYVSTGFNGIKVIDISDPNNPFEIEHYPTTAFTLDAVERDGFIFAADGENGLKIINTATNDVSYVGTGGFANGLYVQGQGRLQEEHVYLLDREKGLYVIDISDITSPYILGQYEMESEPKSISKFFHSSYVFIADSEGLQIIQVAP